MSVVRALGLRTALSLKWQEEHLLIVDSCSVEVRLAGGSDEQSAKTAPVNAALTKMSTRNMKRVLYHPQLVSLIKHCEA